MRILSKCSLQKTSGTPASAPERLSLDPAAEVGDTIGDLDHAAVPAPDRMQLDVSIEGHVVQVRFQTDKA